MIFGGVSTLKNISKIIFSTLIYTTSLKYFGRNVNMVDKMNDFPIGDCERTSRFERMVLLMKANPLIPIGVIVTGAIVIRLKYASPKEFRLLIYLRPLSQAITVSMIAYTAYSSPEIFNKSSLTSSK